MAPDSGPQVLIVEDDREIRRFVRAALEDEGYRVSEAETVERGVIDAGTRKPDVAILDLMVPGAPVVQFTYSVASPLPKRLGGFTAEASERIWMNIPPARVWVYRKTDGR